METGLLFIGSQSDCKAFIPKFECYYIYILRRPDGRPFYIGKGRGERVFHHENEARHANNRKSNAYKLNVIRAVLSAGGTSHRLKLDAATVRSRLKKPGSAAMLTDMDPGAIPRGAVFAALLRVRQQCPSHSRD